MNLYRFIKEYTFELSTLGFAIGTVLTLLSALGIWALGSGAGEWFDGMVGNWKYWIFLVCIMVALISGGFLVSFIQSRKELMELLDTDSKATFTRNLDDAEYLAWKLGSRYEIMVEEKKDELRLGRRKSKRK